MLLNFTAPRNGEKIIRIDCCEQWFTCFGSNVLQVSRIIPNFVTKLHISTKV